MTMQLPTAAPHLPAPLSEWHLFHKLLPTSLLNDLDPAAPQTAYTPWIVTWLLIFQRLHGNASLNDAAAEFALRFPAQALPDCKRAREGTLSVNSGSYSLARSRLDVRVLHWATANVFDSLVETFPPSWRDRRAFLIDGSTLPLASTPELRAAFPPAQNQHGDSHWPILHLAVAHELASGLAVVPEFGPMYGPAAVAEVALARRLLARLPARSILLADRNFGIFAFAHAAGVAGHDVLLRLTQPRFAALRKQAKPEGAGRWSLTWRPSRWDRKSNPDLPAGAEVQGWLHEVRVSDTLTLWLFTTAEGSGEEMASLYGQRLHVETDIGDLKGMLKLDELRGRNTDMVEKELLAGVLAYNLANQVRRLAATRLQIEPRRLSFAGVWSLLKAFMAGLLDGKTPAEAEADFERLLRAAGQRKLPRRAKGRSYPREVIPRGRKFPERKRAQQTPAK
jgi:hypothetical protein